MKFEDFVKKMKNVDTKEKRKIMCKELLRNRKLKEFLQVKRASNQEIEQIFSDLYNPFIDEVFIVNNYE